MKILVVSDSHGNVEDLDRLYKIYPKMDLYLHLGDSECDEFQITPFISVRGNCDYFSDFREQIIIPTPMGFLLAQHHPLISTKFLQEKQIKFFLSGHTHRRIEKIQSDVIYLNPGSISYPRDGHPRSYLILEITKDSYKATFKSLE